MSIIRAQAQALRDKFLNDLGTEPTPGELPVIDAVLGLVAKEFIDAASDNLDRTDAVSTGELASALTFSVETEGNTYILTVGYEKGSKAAKYYDFTNKGVQGVKKPGRAPNSPYRFRYLGVSPRHALAILKWIRHNGISAKNVNKGYAVSGLESKRLSLRKSIKEADSLKRLAYAMAMKSKIEGLGPTHYFDDAVKSTFGPELIEALQVALAGEVILHIRQLKEEFK